ncbi:MAG: DUF1573 domain-containing protein [SAR324 cluster bacterium]|nr:DUF1573 domain-containing protein [SAR324 cluster bacterium]
MLRGFFLMAFSLVALTLRAEPRMTAEVHLEQNMVMSGSALQGTVVISNDGDEPLKIRGVETSCGCTTIHLEKRTLAPGDFSTLRFEVDTGGKIGRVEKTITLHTNEPDSPRIITVVFHATAGQDNGEKLRELFRPPCDSCHLTPAADHEGQALFDAVCALCHPVETLKVKVPATAVDYVIRFGLPPLGMPAFGEYLSEAQISSVTEWIGTVARGYVPVPSIAPQSEASGRNPTLP